MHAPLVHVGCFQLGGDPRLKNGFPHPPGDTRPIIDDGHDPTIGLLAGSDEDALRSCISAIAEQLDDDILEALDILSRLASLSFRAAQLDETGAEISLDLERVSVAGFLYEMPQGGI